jgi:hypothetical protein
VRPSEHQFVAVARSLGDMIATGPFDRIVRRNGLTLGTVLSDVGGQARRVCTLDTHPDWLYKEYRSQLNASEIAQLDRLIRLPERFTAAERELIDRNTSWPVSRVVDDTTTVGVILPKAPEAFSFKRNRNGRTSTMLLPLDLLALRTEDLRRRNLPEQSLAARIMVCASFTSVGALFERHGVVYLDWSYKNAFWSLTQLAAYVIDVDGCSFGPRPQMETRGWEDPLVEQGLWADAMVDRYRVALLVARCLTAEREAPAAPRAMWQLAQAEPALTSVAQLVGAALTASTIDGRPPLSALSSALTDAVVQVQGPGATTKHPSSTPPRGRPAVAPEAGPDGVAGWRQVGGRRNAPVPTPPYEPVPGPPTSSVPDIPVYQPLQGEQPAATGRFVTVLLVLAAVVVLIVIIASAI